MSDPTPDLIDRIQSAAETFADAALPLWGDVDGEGGLPLTILDAALRARGLTPNYYNVGGEPR